MIIEIAQLTIRPGNERQFESNRSRAQADAAKAHAVG
jgi:hypothetical protein